VFEHITTGDAADFVLSCGANVAATVTPQHLVINRNAMFAGGLRPHFYCLPVAKREQHRQAVRRAATSGSPKFFLGTDSAPHAVGRKESGCGCAGIFNAPFRARKLCAGLRGGRRARPLRSLCFGKWPPFLRIAA
jgi:dihydroorotase